MHSDRVTLWICLMDGLVVPKIKYFDTVTVFGWLGTCTVTG